MPFDPCVTRIIPELHAWQEHLHRNPELSFEEFETTAYLAELLSAMPGVSVSRPTKTGLVARLKSVDVMVVFTGKVSHQLRREATNAARSKSIPVMQVHSCGVCSLRECLQRLQPAFDELDYSASELDYLPSYVDAEYRDAQRLKDALECDLGGDGRGRDDGRGGRDDGRVITGR